MKSRRVGPQEHYEQAAFMSRLAWITPQLVQFVAAVANGGHRTKATAGRLKAEGVRVGFPDVVVMLARGGYFGLLIEFKRRGATRSDVSDDQDALHRLYRAQGYRVELCAGCEAAWRVFMEYAQSGQTSCGERKDGALAGSRARVFDV
jgi:hypothetical protein